MIWKYNWKSWLSETILKILSTSLVESKWEWGRQNEKICRSFIVYRLLETDTGNWVTSKLESGCPGSARLHKVFASSRSALHSLPSCAVAEWIAIGVKAELAPEDIFSGKWAYGANSALQRPRAQTFLNNKMALTVKLENFTAKAK